MPEKTTFTPPPFLPSDTHTSLERAHSSLRTAIDATEPHERYAAAHLAALHAASALVAAAPKPVPAKGRRAVPLRSAWIRLTDADADLGDWGAYFAAGASKRAACEAGSTRAVTAFEADELTHAADRFIAVIERALGLLPHRLVTKPPVIAAAADGEEKATA